MTEAEHRALAKVTRPRTTSPGPRRDRAAEAASLRASVDRLDAAVTAGRETRVWSPSPDADRRAGRIVCRRRSRARRGNAAGAQQWLLVRGFEGVTRYSHPDAAATVAVRSLKDGVISNARAGRAIEVDLLDTYESLLRSALADTAASTRSGYPAKTAQTAATAAGYWTIVRPAYRTQRGPAATRSLDRTLAALAGSRKTDYQPCARSPIKPATTFSLSAPLLWPRPNRRGVPDS